LTIPTAVMNVNKEKLFSRQIPTRIVIGLVRNDAFNGSTTRNPFNFQNFRLTEISVYSGRTAAAWYKTSDDKL